MGNVRFQLSARIAEEAALIEYLDGFPEDRHSEQLRRLALLGFYQAMRGNAPDLRTSVAEARCPDLKAPESRARVEPTPQPPSTNIPQTQVSHLCEEKSFASLKHIIG